jgi:hypothetical protein
MQSTTSDSAVDPGSAAASSGIRIEGVLLLTGTLGLFFLLMSWSCAIYVLVLVAFGAYFAIVGSMSYAAVSIASMIIVALGWSITRWIVRGLLEEERHQRLLHAF